MKKSIILFICFGVVQSSFAGVYSLSFPRVAVSGNGASCQAFLEKAAHEIVAQTGVKILGQECKIDEYTVRGLDAVITYQSPVPLSRTSSFYSPLYSAAFYSNYQQCNDQLEVQKKLFSEALGIKAVAAYCMLEISLKPKWQTRVDGIGESKVKAGAAAVSFWGKIVNEQQVIKNFQAAAESFGLNLFEVGISQDLDKKIVLRYYSSKPYSMRDYSSMKYGSVDACLVGTSSVDSILETSKLPAVAFCELENATSKTSVLHVASFVETLEPKESFRVVKLPTHFATLNECENASQEIATGSSDILGAVCAGATKDFQIHVFSRP